MRICIVHGGHVSCCPRMVKAADAFAAAGHDVRMVYTQHLDWAYATDAALLATRAWRTTAVKLDRRSRARFHLARKVAHLVGETRAPLALVARAFGRFHSELVAAIVAEPADLIYGGSSGALAAAAIAADRLRIPFALDLEDHHSTDEPDTAVGRARNALAASLERALMPRACFATTASAGIADAYAQEVGVRPLVVHNTFPLPSQSPEFAVENRPLRLYWFSQTIGHGRGLEDAIAAVAQSGVAAELHVRGRVAADYLDALRRLAPSHLRIHHHSPAPPDEMVALCRGMDIGLSIEPDRNRALTITNKGLTYILAGLAVVFNDTIGQRPLANDLGAGALTIPTGDTVALAAALKHWSTDRESLVTAKRAAWSAAERRWHWEHPQERGALLESLARVGGADAVEQKR